MLHTEVSPGVLGMRRKEVGAHEMLHAKNIHGFQDVWLLQLHMVSCALALLCDSCC